MGCVKLRRIIGGPDLNMLDPFLLFDEFGSDDPDDYIGGFLSSSSRFRNDYLHVEW